MHGSDRFGEGRGSQHLINRDEIEVIGERNFEGIKAIFGNPKGWRVSQAVAWIAETRMEPATGFLVSPDRLMTCWHVFEERSWAEGAVARFRYIEVDEDPQDEILPYTEYQIDPDIFFYNNRALDFAVVGVADNPDELWGRVAGERWGTIPFPCPAPEIPEEVIIIQHPCGRPKEIVRTDNQVIKHSSTRIWYLADTEPGSSGSPVFNSDYNWVALHNRWTKIRDPISNEEILCNEGILATAIQADFLQREEHAKQRRRGCLLK